MHRLLLRRHATTWEKKPTREPTREPTIGSLRVAQRPTSFRGFPKLWVSTRGNATRWDSQGCYDTNKIALRIRRLQVRIVPSAPSAPLPSAPLPSAPL